MTVPTDFMLVPFVLWLLTLEFIETTFANSCALNVNPYITVGKALDGHVIWNSTTENETECAKQCIKRRTCKSFNYDALHRRCELNNAVLTTAVSERNGPHLLYSDIADWPSQVDPECYARPCGDDEVCVPGHVTGHVSAGTTCHFSCFKMGRQCPIPTGATDVSQPRTVGSIYQHTCDRGYVGGGDSGLCLPTGEWNKTIDTTCTSLHGSSCSGNNDCVDINGLCVSNTCQCGPLLTYDTTTLTCLEECPLPAGGTDISQPRTVGAIYQHTCGRGYVGGDSGLCLPTGAWNKTIDTTCTSLHGYSCSGTNDCLDINGACVAGTCQCASILTFDTTAIMCIQTVQCALGDGSMHPVGYIYNVVCASGFVGSDEPVECLAIGLWNGDTGCYPLHGYSCSGTNDCLDINGACVAGTCQCASTLTFDTTAIMCIQTVQCALGDGTMHPVGYIYNVVCARGFVGSDEPVECLAIGLWNGDTGCYPLHGYSCSGTNDCLDINGACVAGTCQCASPLTFDTAAIMCIQTVQCALGDGTMHPVGYIYNVVCERGFVGGDEPVECLAIGLWNGDTSCTPLYGSSCSSDGECADIEGTCTDNTCQCGQYETFDAATLFCVDRVCEAGWEQYEQHCYLFEMTEMQYDAARTFCDDKNSTLVQMDTVDENNFLRSRMGDISPAPADGYWCDLFQLTTNGAEVWRTSNDAYDTSVSGWCCSNPDDWNGVESCTIFWADRNYRLVDVSCDNDVRTDGTSYGYPNHRPVCEKGL